MTLGDRCSHSGQTTLGITTAHGQQGAYIAHETPVSDPDLVVKGVKVGPAKQEVAKLWAVSSSKASSGMVMEALGEMHILEHHPFARLDTVWPVIVQSRLGGLPIKRRQGTCTSCQYRRGWIPG